jgi:hypothetical protein
MNSPVVKCEGCGKELQKGEFCSWETVPINDKAPYKYTTRGWHWECYQEAMEKLKLEWRNNRLAKKSE